MNTRWGRAGWGRTPATLRRHQAPPSFLHRHESELEAERLGRYGESDDVSRDIGAELEPEIEGEWAFSALEPSA